MFEYAHRGRFGKHCNIEKIPEFRSHLEREGITFEQWQRRNNAASLDMVGESLRLRLRALKAKFK